MPTSPMAVSPVSCSIARPQSSNVQLLSTATAGQRSFARTTFTRKPKVSAGKDKEFCNCPH